MTYDFVNGFVTLSASDLTNTGYTITLSNAGDSNLSQVLLNGTQATFDSSALTLNSFAFAAPTQTLAVTVTNGSTPVISFDVALSGLQALNDPTTYSSSAAALGGGDYTFAANGVDVSTNYTLSSGASGSGTIHTMHQSLNGSIALSSMGNFQLDAAAIGDITVGPTGHQQVIQLTAEDIVFNGAPAVPLPAAVWLFGSGLSFLGGLPLLRRRRAVAA